MSGVWMALAAIGHSFLDRFGRVRAQASLDALDEKQYSDASWFAGLGVTGMPFGPTREGFVEGVIVDYVGPYSGIILAARDGRCTKVYGQLAPGDTALHTTGPDACTQVLLKRDQRLAAIVTKDSEGKTAIVSLDGKGDTFTIAIAGWAMQITREGGIQLCARNGMHGISVTDQGVHIRGNVLLGGMTPVPGMYLMLGPASGQNPATGPAVLIPALGVAVGQ